MVALRRIHNPKHFKNVAPGRPSPGLNVTDMNNKKLSWFFCLAGLLAGVILTASFGAFADGDPATDDVPRTLPYQGVLELDGAPVNAEGLNALHILFELYDGQDAEVPTYSQPIVVEVYDGRFTATIGPLGLNADNEEVEITEIITAADDLYLGMTLLGDPDDPDDDIALSNRQRIHASPYAMWTTSATNLNVARDLVVGRNLDVAGDLAVGGNVVLPVGAIDTADIANESLVFDDLDPEILGVGLEENGGAIRVDDDHLSARIRSYVRSNCHVELGWRDNCSNCGSNPAKFARVRADDTCVAASGSDTRCRGTNNRYGGVNLDGTADGNDVFYIRFFCN